MASVGAGTGTFIRVVVVDDQAIVRDGVARASSVLRQTSMSSGPTHPAKLRCAASMISPATCAFWT